MHRIVSLVERLELTTSDLIGISGVIIILWYYFLLQVGKSKSESFAFSFANLVGSLLVLISLWSNWNLSSVIIEVFWLIISFCGTVRAISSHRKNEKAKPLHPILPKAK